MVTFMKRGIKPIMDHSLHPTLRLTLTNILKTSMHRQDSVLIVQILVGKVFKKSISEDR